MQTIVLLNITAILYKIYPCVCNISHLNTGSCASFSLADWMLSISGNLYFRKPLMFSLLLAIPRAACSRGWIVSRGGFWTMSRGLWIESRGLCIIGIASSSRWHEFGCFRRQGESFPRRFRGFCETCFFSWSEPANILSMLKNVMCRHVGSRPPPQSLHGRPQHSLRQQ